MRSIQTLAKTIVACVAGFALVFATVTPASALESERCLREKKFTVSESECHRVEGTYFMTPDSGPSTPVQCHYRGFLAWLAGYGYYVSWTEYYKCPRPVSDGFDDNEIALELGEF